MPNATPIYAIGTDSVVSFASEELARYLGKITGIEHRVETAKSRLTGKGIYLGTKQAFEGFGLQVLQASGGSEDAIALKTSGDKLLVVGSNPRSVLFAAYRYLERLGTEWLWPGEDGEILPRLEEAKTDGFDLEEMASYSHRGVCIEGAVTPETVIEFIDWMAKRRMNEFFLQFKTSRFFYNRYYARRYNPRAKPSPKISVDESLKFDARVIEELKRRGMIVERVGHGWTCEAIGIEGLGWDPEEKPISEGQRELVALVDGRRELFGKIAVNTELCYSNPKAFDALVDHVVQYALEHPEVDLLHFWLSDGMNNHCECEGCAKLSPSDWYAKLVNAVSHRLGEAKCKTKVVFLCYANTLWAPKQEVVDDLYKNTVFMFAPISRCYLHKLSDAKCSSSKPLEPAPRNRMVPPRTNREFVQLLRGWQKTLRSDSFLFDYHFWSGFSLDFLGGDIGDVLWRDLRDLMELGLNGFLSCQTLRSFYPTGIPMAIMAETLWNNKTEIEGVKDRYLKAAFGEDAPFVSSYLGKIYSLVGAKNGHGHVDPLSALSLKVVQELLEYVKESRARIEIIASKGTGAAKKSALYLLHHNTYVSLLLEALSRYLKGEKEKAVEEVEGALNHLLSTEDEIFKVADVYIMSSALNEISSRILAKKPLSAQGS
ncbi:MAG: DUF4838 domain-containing protein [Candidatus Brockarchaeota archaeon]|nr:DUF4838 domain-containing protein [Candidatus Brockarchaeota archaeon]